MEADFSGWATKANLKCSDGRTIMPEAFAEQDGVTVPLVWQHMHNDTGNVLGHAVLTAKPEGVWADGFFNDTPAGLNAKALVQHKDIDSLSIYANSLVEKSKKVFHGVIRELSLVLSGANPGAKIENIRLAHSNDPEDGFDVLEDEAVIYSGELIHSAEVVHEADDEGAASSDDEGPSVQEVYDSLNDEQLELVHSMIEEALTVAAAATEGSEDGEGLVIHADTTVQDVYNSFTEEQKKVVHYMIGAALEAAQEMGSAAHSGINNNEGDLTHQEGTGMSRNVFDQDGAKSDDRPTLSHSDLETIVETAKKGNGSFKEAFLAHAEQTYGITDIDFLFPDAKTMQDRPDLIARRTEWVKTVLDGAKHSPFSRIKSLAADLTAEEARAKGYVKGNLKKDEVIKLLKRVTTPTTIYKKQKLDRDDIVDITDLDVVAWLKWEMRFMLEEELARAILIGDGREPDDDDKIDEEKVRPIAWDDDMYTHKVNLDTNVTPSGIVEGILRARKFYKGTGTPTLFTTDDIVTDMLLIRDKIGRREYNTMADLSAALRVDRIVVVEVMEDEADLLGILVNMSDYTIGADKGGQLAMFDDFDIDYNQQKYLMETRISGCLTKPKSAIAVRRVSGTTVTPVAPAFDQGTNTITVPTVTGVSYFDVTDPLNEVELTDGADVVITETTDVEARADSGYNFPHNTDADWTFAYVAP